MSRNKAKAADAYAKRQNDLRTLSQRLTTALQVHAADATTTRTGITWGHVGDLQGVTERLLEALQILEGHDSETELHELAEAMEVRL